MTDRLKNKVIHKRALFLKTFADFYKYIAMAIDHFTNF